MAEMFFAELEEELKEDIEAALRQDFEDQIDDELGED